MKHGVQQELQQLEQQQLDDVFSADTTLLIPANTARLPRHDDSYYYYHYSYNYNYNSNNNNNVTETSSQPTGHDTSKHWTSTNTGWQLPLLLQLLLLQNPNIMWEEETSLEPRYPYMLHCAPTSHKIYPLTQGIQTPI